MKPRKKAYESPELTAYGDVREITKSSVGGKGDDDSAKGNKKSFL